MTDMRVFLAVLVAAIVAGCSDGLDTVSVADACADQAEVFCGQDCHSSWTTCREDYVDACDNPKSIAPTEEEHVACLDALTDDEDCGYPISVPSECWLLHN